MSTEPSDEIQDLIGFLQSPTPFHVVESVTSRLLALGFQPFSHDLPELRSGAGYFIATEGTLIAFRLPELSNDKWSNVTTLPLRIWGAHTDSPTLKVKPHPDTMKHGHLQIGVEVYGGAILNTWLDRPLAVAGKIFTAQKNGVPKSHLVNLSDPEMMMIIPNAAIHLNRNINKGFTLVPDKHLLAFGARIEGSGMEKTSREGWLERVAAKSGIEGDILSHDLYLYDPQPPVLFGQDQQLLNSPRLDNLAMVHAGLKGFLRRSINGEVKEKKSSSDSKPFVSGLAFFNHEEVGSMTHEGAASGLLLRSIELFYEKLHGLFPQLNRHSWVTHDSSPNSENHEGSFLISADMAHGFHPHYESWYESNHSPVLNGGIVIKHNAAFRYTSSGASAARIKSFLGKEPALPVQEYIQNSEIPCGSTIGPLVSGRLAIPAVDIGNPLWAMHSIRETTGVKDHLTAVDLAERFFSI